MSRGSHLSNTTCLTHVFQKWWAMQQIELVALHEMHQTSSVRQVVVPPSMSCVRGVLSCSDQPKVRAQGRKLSHECDLRERRLATTASFPTNIIPTKIVWLKLIGKFPMGLGIPPRKIKISLESNPLTSIMLVRRLTAYPRYPHADMICWVADEGTPTLTNSP